MKFIKYLVVALLFGATLTSCGPEEGTVGQTTVQFATTQVKAGFGAGTIYVPISIFGANADAMNTADVTVSVKVDDTYVSSDPAVYVGQEDLDGALDENGEPVKDFRITSYDILFRNNYDIPEEDSKKPFKKEASVEIMILNDDVDVMEFKLVLDTSNTTIGATKECVVRLEKGPSDRLCGDWWVNFSTTIDLLGGQPDFTGPFATEMYYNQDLEALYFSDPIVGLPFIFYYDDNTQKLTYPTFEVLMPYDASAGQYVCQWVFMLDGDGIVYAKDKAFDCEYDPVNYSYIKIPKMAEENWSTLPTVLQLDENYNLESLLGWFHNESLVGLNLVRTKPVGKAPAMAPEADYTQPEGTTFVEATEKQSEAFKKAYLERFGTLKVDVRR